MAKQKLSIKDVAAQLKISITTVSFILNGKAKENRISEKLTKKVLDHIEKVGYQPSQLAQSLRTGKSKILVFMVEDISNYFYSSIARKLEEKAYATGYKIIYCSTENDIKKAQELIQVFKGRQVDGYIITAPDGLEEDIKGLMEEGLPVVLFDRYFPNLDVSHVVINNNEATSIAISKLIFNGYKNIGFVTLESKQTQMMDRYLGYEKAIKDHGLSLHLQTIPYSDIGTDRVAHTISTFIAEEKPTLDALFFSTNYLTISGLSALKSHHKIIPTDIAVIAFDDNDLFKLYDPPISAISQPIEEMANKLMEVILTQLKGEMVIEKIELPVQYIHRESSGIHRP
ncbi:LacI family DNA-binding transcriptional regulator [Anditalea andensis]|uniref:LacI family transcriptional regulator n=1 Tax=Anditalea andensis TaxID=1048983 RepID=A0A074L2E3_9BACT|nr:LacI family DNA-binding transcriptional regulator [Anditalea andensis]KEO75354.1 LacI family transcriptional regulator [Anditalea andensis]